ncbi:hypothetical protein [Halodesulfovibrio aestuarii]|uniref:hypothetical protein n=1 Tax=Halodesulfovibrio aestuarii TaxID=126333 RepID=UPI00041627B7
MSDRTFDLKKDEISFDSDGNVVISNKDFIKKVKKVLDENQLQEVAKGDNGCGNDVNILC